MVESNQGFASLTTVYPVQERNTLSTITIGHIDAECHYVSTTALQSNASISMCNELMNGTQSSRNKHFIMAILTGFVSFFRPKFPGLFQDTDWFFKGSKIHINPYTPKISMLILLTAFHTLHSFSFSRTFQDQRLFSKTFLPGLSSPGKCHNKVQGLSRFSRTLRNLHIYSLFLCHEIMHLLGFFNTTGSPWTCLFVLCRPCRQNA